MNEWQILTYLDVDYLCDPLKDSMGDEDPYVRKTAAICVAKLYEINP
jgi:AP-1 complex subunit beta-1